MSEYKIYNNNPHISYIHFGTDGEPTQIYHYEISRGYDIYYCWTYKDNMPAIITCWNGLRWYEAGREYQPHCKKL